MSRLALRRGLVTVIADATAPVVELAVAVDGLERAALSYPELTGPVEVGDDVVVNVAAVELGLGSGGFDVVHVNLTRGLTSAGPQGAHVMKLNYTSLQHAVTPVEEAAPELVLPLDRPVAVLSLHAQLPCVAWAVSQTAPGARVGFVQTAGGALPAAHSNVVRELRSRGLLADQVAVAPCFGGQYEAISVAGALHAALTALEWDAAIVGPGPGILGSATALGHGGLVALDSINTALALGCPALVVPRASSGDPRDRHRGLSHHTQIVLDLLREPVEVAVPEGEAGAPIRGADAIAAHVVVEAATDLEGYAASGLPARTMGRPIADDDLFFRAALAGGVALGRRIVGV